MASTSSSSSSSSPIIPGYSIASDDGQLSTQRSKAKGSIQHSASITQEFSRVFSYNAGPLLLFLSGGSSRVTELKPSESKGHSIGVGTLMHRVMDEGKKGKQTASIFTKHLPSMMPDIGPSLSKIKQRLAHYELSNEQLSLIHDTLEEMCGLLHVNPPYSILGSADAMGIASEPIAGIINEKKQEEVIAEIRKIGKLNKGEEPVIVETVRDFVRNVYLEIERQLGDVDGRSRTSAGDELFRNVEARKRSDNSSTSTSISASALIVPEFEEIKRRLGHYNLSDDLLLLIQDNLEEMCRRINATPYGSKESSHILSETYKPIRRIIKTEKLHKGKVKVAEVRKKIKENKGKGYPIETIQAFVADVYVKAKEQRHKTRESSLSDAEVMLQTPKTRPRSGYTPTSSGTVTPTSDSGSSTPDGGRISPPSLSK